MGKQVNVVLLTGCKRSGKDSAAQVLIDRGWVNLAFADPLRTMALAINPIVNYDFQCNVVRLKDMVESYGWDFAKRDPEVRRLLQVIGTEAVR